MTDVHGLGEALRICLERGLTFAAFRKPGDHVALWVQRNAAVEKIETSLLLEANDVFLIAPFDLAGDKLSIIRPDIGYLFSDPTMDLELLAQCSGGNGRTASLSPATTAVDFEGAVSKAKDLIVSGAAQKIVLSRVLTIDLQRDGLPDLFIRAIEAYPEAMVTLMNTPEHGTWMGASPEMLIREEEDVMQVDALAGTMPFSERALELGSWGDKELEEQDMVTRGVLNAFLEAGSTGVRVRGPEVIRAGPVVHLRSTINAELGDHPLADVVLALHPTPAVCGTPTDVARRFIKSHETHDRRLYAGFWGPWAPDGRTDLYVNIRCMEVVNDQASLHVGAGITTGSDPQREWQETGHKARTWLDLIEGSGIEG